MNAYHVYITTKYSIAQYCDLAVKCQDKDYLQSVIWFIT